MGAHAIGPYRSDLEALPSAAFTRSRRDHAATKVAGHARDAARSNRSYLDDRRAGPRRARRCVAGTRGRRYGRFTVIDGGRE